MSFLDKIGFNALIDAPLALLGARRMGIPMLNMAQGLILKYLPYDASDSIELLTGGDSLGGIAEVRIKNYIMDLERSVSRGALLNAGVSYKETNIDNFEKVLSILGWNAKKDSIIAEAVRPLDGMFLFGEHVSHAVPQPGGKSTSSTTPGRDFHTY